MSEKSEAATPNKGNAALTDTLVRWLKLIAILLTLIGFIVATSAAWTTMEARATALERSDEVFMERVLRIESEQAQMRDVLVVLQQGQAGMDAKLDILVGDRRKAP
ncbi:hypothetical protein LCGC14_0520210 [marine sediment metagenome]|uniref:Uncharacterized protein n=1 Tax=marine sediment metagenome TaxID=412755 RepID=A0A0F9V6S6_9ZZZZ